MAILVPFMLWSAAILVRYPPIADFALAFSRQFAAI